MQLVIVTGMSGAGKSRVIDNLEDIGFFCVDNMTPKLIPTFVQLLKDSAEVREKVAIVADIRLGGSFSHLFNAIEELKSLGIDAVAFPADASDRDSIKKLVDFSSDLGDIKTVIHAAGVSPHMDNPEMIFNINAIGTINIDEEFGPAMAKGGAILNVASMAAYAMPPDQVPANLYKLVMENVESLANGFKQMISAIPGEEANGFAYSVSKNFVFFNPNVKTL